MKILKGFILAWFVFSFLSCENEEGTDSPKFPLAFEHNIDEQKLRAAYDKAEQITGLKSLLVSRDGVLISEQYFTEMGAEDVYDVRSVTKSVISALVGIAINEGFIDSLDQALLDFIGPLGYSLEGEKALITIRDLLTMSAGFEWNEFESGYNYRDWATSPDQIEYCINGVLENSPGDVFSYSSEEAHLLSVILTVATGMSTHDFALEYLFEPLGMDIMDFTWAYFPQGYFNGGAALSLKPRDMIKLGNLYLNNGMYNGNQIIPSEWIHESTSFHITTNLQGYLPDYGYLWWINKNGTNNYYFANGYAGQLIGVYPDLNLVVVSTSNWQLSTNEAGQQWYNIMTLIQNDILNSIN